MWVYAVFTALLSIKLWPAVRGNVAFTITNCTTNETRYLHRAATDAQMIINKVVAFETGQVTTIGKIGYDDISILRSRYFGNLTSEDSQCVTSRCLMLSRVLQNLLHLCRCLPKYAALPANGDHRVCRARSKQSLRPWRCSIRMDANEA